MIRQRELASLTTHGHATGCFRCGRSTGTKRNARTREPYKIERFQVRVNGRWVWVRARVHIKCARVQHNAGRATDQRAERFASHAYAPRPKAGYWEARV